MNEIGDITKLKASWTKYDCVQMIEIIGDDKLSSYLNQSENIDLPTLCHYLGINKISDSIPQYWMDIRNYPSQKRLFALIAGIFTHHLNIALFAEKYSSENMQGVFKIGEGSKHLTNLRSALVVSGAAKNSYRRRNEVPYDLSSLFDEGEVGKLFKQLLIDRLKSVGYSSDYLDKNFLFTCFELNFQKALSLTEEQFKRWTEGKRIAQIRNFDYNLSELSPSRNIPVFKVNQWLNSWDEIDFSQPLRSKPDPYFFIFNMDIRLLKRLSDVHRRKANKRRSEDSFIQRGHDEKRSFEIRNFVNVGFPLSTASESERNSPESNNLRMPGILPTAIVVNILGVGQKRGNAIINEQHLVKVKNIKSNNPSLIIPDAVFDNNWDPELKPIEIIDGQHRLMAFDETEALKGNYEVPVVAYYNLDRTWQAYLFYVINIKPKKINTSLGYDLYPLLRTQDWLENTKDGLVVYRETRAQELVEALWFYDQSPWFNRINMLGSNDGSYLSQAAFIRALTSSYLKKTARKAVSGLFADVLSGKNFEEIRWVRAQQAAFLILLWEHIALISSASNQSWAKSLKNEKKQLLLFDSTDKRNSSLEINDAFLSKNSMLTRDQGVTGISMFTNDLFFVAANYFSDYDFNSIEWKDDIDERQIEINSIDKAINQFRDDPLNSLIKEVAKELMNFDWRMPTAEFEDKVKQEIQKKYKGSGGYGEVWRDLLEIFKKSSNSQIRSYALKLESLSTI